MKKVLIILVDLLLIALLVITLGFSNSREKELLCTEVRIHMIDTLEAGFLKKADIEKIIFSKDQEILGYPVSEINTRELEGKLQQLPYIKDAQIYSNLNGTLIIDVLQRQPVLRVITRNNRSYYLDREGFIFPSRKNFTPHVMIANGYFTEGSELANVRNLEEIADNSRYKEWFGVLDLANYIQDDELWDSQVVQIYYNRNGDFELIPRVGAHQIIFGEAVDIAGKFQKLRILYEEGLKYEGWNNYEKINLKYNHQVICTKR